jgi:hypothetical protein
MARTQVAVGGDGLQIWRVAAIILNKQSRTAGMGWSSSLLVGHGVTTPHRKLVTMIEWRRVRWAGHVARMMEKRNVLMISVGKPEGKRPLGRPRRRWVDNIKMDLREIGCLVWTGLIWFRIGTSGGLLYTRQWTFGFHKMLGSSWAATQLAASQEGLSSKKLVS